MEHLRSQCSGLSLEHDFVTIVFAGSGCCLLGKNMVLLTVCVVVAMIQLWYIWFRVIRARTIIVDYYKFDLGSKFNQNGDALRDGEKELDEDTFVRSRAVYHKVRKAMGIEKKKLKRTFRTTRFKLDILMPITFSVIWVGLLVSEILSVF